MRLLRRDTGGLRRAPADRGRRAARDGRRDRRHAAGLRPERRARRANGSRIPSWPIRSSCRSRCPTGRRSCSRTRRSCWSSRATPTSCSPRRRSSPTALPEERLIARLFWGDIDAARRLTGGDPHRTQVVAGIATTLLQRLRKPELVCNVGQTVLPGHDGKRMVDRLAAGEADAVAAELADGRIDAARAGAQRRADLHRLVTRSRSARIGSG